MSLMTTVIIMQNDKINERSKKKKKETVSL